MVVTTVKVWLQYLYLSGLPPLSFFSLLVQGWLENPCWVVWCGDGAGGSASCPGSPQLHRNHGFPHHYWSCALPGACCRSWQSLHIGSLLRGDLLFSHSLLLLPSHLFPLFPILLSSFLSSFLDPFFSPASWPIYSLRVLIIHTFTFLHTHTFTPTLSPAPSQETCQPSSRQSPTSSCPWADWPGTRWGCSQPPPDIPLWDQCLPSGGCVLHACCQEFLLLCWYCRLLQLPSAGGFYMEHATH